MIILFVVNSTMKQNCSAGIKFSLSEDGQSLVVTEIKEDHNHEVSEVRGYNGSYMVTIVY